MLAERGVFLFEATEFRPQRLEAGGPLTAHRALGVQVGSQSVQVGSQSVKRRSDRRGRAIEVPLHGIERLERLPIL
jgi:hypothetical protein